MALVSAPGLFNARNLIKINFSTTCCLNNKWRRQQGLEDSPRKFSPLTYLPDYSFVDGRPTPLSKRKLEKLKLQEHYCKRIVELSHELDVALETYHQNQLQQKQHTENVLKSKLKPKGAALLEKSTQNDTRK